MTKDKDLKEMGWTELEIARWKKYVKKLDEIYGDEPTLMLAGPDDLTADLKRVAKKVGATLYSSDEVIE